MSETKMHQTRELQIQQNDWQAVGPSCYKPISHQYNKILDFQTICKLDQSTFYYTSYTTYSAVLNEAPKAPSMITNKLHPPKHTQAYTGVFENVSTCTAMLLAKVSNKIIFAHLSPQVPPMSTHTLHPPALTEASHSSEFQTTSYTEISEKVNTAMLLAIQD